MPRRQTTATIQWSYSVDHSHHSVKLFSRPRPPFSAFIDQIVLFWILLFSISLTFLWTINCFYSIYIFNMARERLFILAHSIFFSFAFVRYRTSNRIFNFLICYGIFPWYSHDYPWNFSLCCQSHLLKACVELSLQKYMKNNVVSIAALYFHDFISSLSCEF